MAAETKNTIWKELKKPFAPKVIGLLPKVNCYACAQSIKDAKSAFEKHCDKHAMVKCQECDAYITTGHIHLDYVGHAAVTDRLNSVDPTWTWEPMALDSQGSPALDAEKNLWIKLTVGGVSRLGVGDGPDMKQRIGDALRNAAMRFGVALDLWSKEELESHLAEPEMKNQKVSGDADTETPPPPAPTAPKAMPKLDQGQVAKLLSLAKNRGQATKTEAVSFINTALTTDDFTQLDPSHFEEYKKAVITAPLPEPFDG